MLRLRAIGALLLGAALGACATQPLREGAQGGDAVGRHEVRSLSLPAGIILSSATYTPSGKILVSYRTGDGADPRQVRLATMADDGTGFRPFFAQRLPDRPKDNGVRWMVFEDNRRIFTGDFVVECSKSLEACDDARLIPVEYPAEVAGGDHVSHRWSEIIVAPDNRHIAWTTLLADYSAVVMTGALVRDADHYRIADTRIVSNRDLFLPDPKHRDGALPVQVRGGEVKQFVEGGTAISLAGMTGHDIPDSVVMHLGDARMEGITWTPGYTETTIFSPDERLGIVMTTRFSKATDPAVLGLLPRPYPDSLKMNLSMLAYTYAVTGARRGRPGNVGPALIDIQRSKQDHDYQGVNLSIEPDWVYYSPMSWHPSGTKAMWMEGNTKSEARRIRIVQLPDYHPARAVGVRPWPGHLADSSTDLSIIPNLAGRDQKVDARVYGKVSGHIDYRRTGSRIEKTYSNFSDDGQHVYSGFERMDANPQGKSIYTAEIDLTGKIPGAMHLTVAFGPLNGALPAQLDFTPDAAGKPASHGYAEYKGQRLEVSSLLP